MSSGGVEGQHRSSQACRHFYSVQFAESPVENWEAVLADYLFSVLQICSLTHLSAQRSVDTEQEQKPGLHYPRKRDLLTLHRAMFLCTRCV
jgi:hypothetical protein